MAVANKLSSRTKKPDLSPLLYGTPPQAADLEGAVLGAIMLEPQKLAEVLEIIQDVMVLYRCQSTYLWCYPPPLR